MENENNAVYYINHPIEVNKHIMYRDKSYGIDFDLIKKSSKFFKDHQQKYESIKIIKLEEPIELDYKSVQKFIDCCHFQNVSFSDSNIIEVNYLSIKYQVTGLETLTKRYIEQNYDNLIFQVISFKLKVQEHSTIFDLKPEENFLATHLNTYFNDERIIQLPIPSLDRILQMYIKMNNMTMG